MPDKPKPADPVKDEEAKASAVAAGKQPAVESDDDDDDDDGEEEGGAGAEQDKGASAATTSSKKKKSKRKKIKEVLSGKSADPQADLKKAIDNLPPDQLQELLKMNPALAQELAALREGSGSGSSTESAIDSLKRLKLQDIMTGLASSGKNAKDMASYKFWQTQPVPKFGEDQGGTVEEGTIKVQKLEDIPTETPKLIEGFEWDTLDLTQPDQLKEVYELLNGHYVEDDQAMFRFNYSPSILKWTLMCPGWTKDWHIGVRASQSKKLVAFIGAIPMKIRVRNKVLDAPEVNFLVVHKKLRSKRLAPVLIKEITRLINLKEIWHAIYTAGIVLPKPISTCRYYHRTLNWQKLYEVGFTYLPPNSKPQYQIRKYAVPDQTSIKGLREMQPKDLDAVRKLLTRYLARFDLGPEFTKEEAEHWLLDKKEEGNEQVVFSYVVENENKKITDFFSFYALDSSVINNPKHQVVHAAYLFYYATEAGLTTPVDKSALKTRLNELMSDALILAKQNKFDVFNALSLMENALFLENLKFGAGDGQLHYYLFNYRANPIAGGVNKKNQLDDNGLSGVGFVML